MLSCSRLTSEDRSKGGGFARGIAKLGAVLLGSVFAVTVQAFPALDLMPKPNLPDISAAFIDVDYVGDNDFGTLTAAGFAITLTPPGVPDGSITGGTFNINADLGFNSLSASGNLSIGGTIAGLGFNSGTLLTGTLSAFGAGPGDPLEFLFNVTGGDAAALYGGIGAQAGVILNNSGYSGSFGSGFSSINGVADTFSQVPLPGTLALMLAGFGMLLMRRRQVG